ncbi:MAG: ferritin family protein, partial [Nitrospirota bacterium]
ATVWKKILRLESVPKGNESCHTNNKENLEESHARETRAIEFYKKAAAESENERVKQIFEAFVEVETDHLNLSEERLK